MKSDLGVLKTVALATRDINVDEQILFIPADIMLQLENTVDAPANSWLTWNPKVEEKMQMKDQHKIAMYILHEKNNSKWKYKRFFESLGKENSNHVAMWEEEQMEILKPSWLFPHISNLR